MTGTYPFFHGTDRSMANNYMRPGFTQGVWANGELFPGFNYIAMIGNSLNTLDIAATNIDYNFAYSASVWYDRNEFGKAWNDYEDHDKPALRVGTAFTFAREDRLSDLATASPENNATFISDGTLLFETGALAPGVTLQLANFYLWAIDAASSTAASPSTSSSTSAGSTTSAPTGRCRSARMYDWGFEASLGYFVIPQRARAVRADLAHPRPLRDGVEGAVGFNWYPFGTRRVWLTTEVILIKQLAVPSVLYVYSSGQTGLLSRSSSGSLLTAPTAVRARASASRSGLCVRVHIVRILHGRPLPAPAETVSRAASFSSPCCSSGLGGLGLLRARGLLRHRGEGGAGDWRGGRGGSFPPPSSVNQVDL